MTTHTKGPWTTVFSDELHTALVTRKLDDYTYDDIAHVYNKSSTTMVLNTKTEANARLIAAAPELLEALKKAVSEWEGWITDQLEGTRFFKEAMKKLEPIKHTIAKAEGKTEFEKAHEEVFGEEGDE